MQIQINNKYHTENLALYEQVRLVRYEKKINKISRDHIAKFQARRS